MGRMSGGLAIWRDEPLFSRATIDAPDCPLRARSGHYALGFSRSGAARTIRRGKGMRGLRRLTGMSGILGAVLISTAFFGGTPPGIDDTGRAVLAYAADHRTFVLVFFFLDGIATCLMLLFFAGLRHLLAVPQQPERDVWSSAMFASALAVFTLGIAGQACATALAFRADSQTPDAARTLWDLFAVLVGASNLLTIILGVAAAVAIALSPQLPRWLAVGAGVFAAAHLGATVSWARSGAFSQTGVFTILAPVLYLAWVVAVAVVLLRTRNAHD